MTADVRTSKAIRAALRGYAPTEEQWVAIAHPLEPAFLVAGAGSGKTAVMTARIVWAIESEGYRPDQILGLTFTNKAAEELQSRVREALAEADVARPEDITVQTYNAFAASVVREHGLLVGVEPEAGLMSEAQQWQLVLGCIDELPPFEAIELRTPGAIVRSTLSLAGSISDHVVNTEDVRASDDRILSMPDATDEMRETAAQRRELCNSVDAYLRAKMRHQKIDFGDQVTRAVQILGEFPQVQEQYAERFPVVLLDEYQDTNVAQRRMLQSLVKGHNRVTAVGDARQAIFAWRGATMYNLIGFPRDFERSDGEPYGPISLSENFRSGSSILALANQVVEPIDPGRRPGLPLTAHPANGEGRVGIGLFEDERAEARFIADEIERLRGTAMADGRAEVRWKDIAILVRRKATMDPILEVLEERDIPVEVVGLAGLLKTPEVIEVISWLRAIDPKPSANRWLGRLLLGPRWRVHYRDLALCARWAARRNSELRLRLAGGDKERAEDLEPGDVAFSLAEVLDHLDEIEGLGAEAKRRMTALNDRLASLRKKMHSPLLELVQEVIRQTGIGDALEASASRSAPAAKQNLSNLLDHVAAFAPVEGEATLRSFIAYLDAADAAEETLEAMQPAEQDSVKLMTVHSAKGLEFECVFVPSVAARTNQKGEHTYSIFPNTRASNPLRSYGELPYDVRADKAHLPAWTGKTTEFERAVKERALEDERRLFYVALTRAKQRLYVTAAWWYGRSDTERGPSLFWKEVRALADQIPVDVVAEAELPADNPVIDALETKRTWPPKPRVGIDDPLFSDGWGAAADSIVGGELDPLAWLNNLDVQQRMIAEELVAERTRELDLIFNVAAAADRGAIEPTLPDIVSATTLVRYDAGELDLWELARPLPDRPTTQRRIGTEIHRLIEERSRGMAAFPDERELDEPGQVTAPGRVSELLSHWATSGYADRCVATLPSGEPMIEVPFSLKRDGRIVRGRIDAVYETDDGGLEVVDFKTGRRFEPKEGADQLEIYAAALGAMGLLHGDKAVKLTYLFLDGETPVTREWVPA